MFTCNVKQVSLKPYRDASIKIMELLESCVPVFEKGGIDEAYVDISALVEARLAAG